MKHTTRPFPSLLLCLLTLALLCSCGVPSASPERAIKALEDAGYTVEEKRVAGLIHFGEGLTNAISASAHNEKEGYTDVIHVLYYENAEAAKKAFDLVKPLGDSYRPSSIPESEWTVARSDHRIYFGTKKAARAAN